MRGTFALLLLLSALSADAGARSKVAVGRFTRSNHCPATGKPRGAVEDRIEMSSSIKSTDTHQTLRLVQMARERIDEIANELFDAA